MDQFGFYQKGGDGYATLIVAQDNRLVELGELSYEAFIRNQWNQAGKPETIYAENVFLDICARKLNGEDVAVLTLFGNSQMWDSCYLQSTPVSSPENPSPF